jgi:hypothetical protein
MGTWISLVVYFYILLLGSSSTEPSPVQWETARVDGANDPFVAVAAEPANPHRLLAATAHAVYETTDDGLDWNERFRTPVGIHVRTAGGVPPRVN